ncbi:MAG: GGDEF domain-containing protein [Terracidiphilus sp.]|jgi:diguanylate cyclase (GGDEF)-like protein
MLWRCSPFPRVPALVLFAFAATLSHAEQASTKVAPIAPLVIDDLGKGTIPLNGPWQFHIGDDPAWAAPAFDDSAWEQLTADRPWGEQGHARVTGFAWYRCQIALTPAPGVPPQFSLLLPRVDDAYEIYWNGLLIGRNGKLQPYPVWYDSQPAQTFRLGQVQRGVLAVRVWKAPLLSDDSGERGGFEAAPEVGGPEAIAAAKSVLDYQWLHSRQFLFGENLLYALVALLSFLAWWRNRGQWLLFWMTGFALVPPLNLLLLNAHIPWPYVLAMGAAQPLLSIQDISLWFLLLWLLLLHENAALFRLTRILACISLTNATLDGVLIAISWNPRWIGLAQTTDAASALLDTLLEAFPLVLVGFAFSRRKRLDSARWLVAILAFLDEMIVVVQNAVRQGRQFTDWSIASKIDLPLFTFGGSAISLSTLTGALLIVSIVYAVYKSLREDQRRQIALEREKAALMLAREQMRRFAEHDDLTGLWNHRIIMERLRGEVDRSRRDGSPMSVVLADIDHFKNINDSFGHPAGDLVLKEISAIFMRTVRSYDWVGRYGGEEFLLILPGSDFHTARIRAEQLRLAVQSARILDGDRTLQVTSSFGVASGFPPDYEAEAVIRTVDEALYRAKDNGRNCVIATDMAMPAGES